MQAIIQRCALVWCIAIAVNIIVVVDASPYLPGQQLLPNSRSRLTRIKKIRQDRRHNANHRSTRFCANSYTSRKTPDSSSSSSSLYANILSRRRSRVDKKDEEEQIAQRPPSHVATLLLSGITPFTIPFRWLSARGFSGSGSGRPIPIAQNPIILAAVAVGGLRIITSERFKRAIYFWKRAGPVVAHYKFTQWWLDVSGAPLEKRDYVYDTLHNKYCDSTMELILHLKGLYVKLGQVVSSRPDFVPSQYIDLFSTLHDSIPQWPVEKVAAILEASLSELGLEFDQVFDKLDPIALGSASIAQVHRATLKAPYADEINGKDVAVKVMHPSAKQQFTHDLQVFRWLCRVALPGWHNILDEFSRQVMTEFDFRREANSLETIRNNLQTARHSREAYVPKPLKGISTKNVLFMELLEGKKLTDSIQDELASIFGGDKDFARSIIERIRRGT